MNLKVLLKISIFMLFPHTIYAISNATNIPAWALSHFHTEKSCNDSAPSIDPLIKKIQESGLGEENNLSNQQNLLKIVAEYLEKSPVPIRAECHYESYGAIKPTNLSSLVKQNPQTLKDFQKITEAVQKSKEIKPYEKVIWLVNLAEIQGFNTSDGRKNIDTAFIMAKEIIEKSNYEDTPHFKKIFELKNWKPEEYEILFAVDRYSDTAEYSVKKNSLDKDLINDIRGFANLIYNCSSETDEIQEKYIVPANDRITKGDQIIQKNTEQLNECVRESQNKIVPDAYKIHEIALQWLVKKYNIRVRTR